MECIYCRSETTKVLNTRHQRRSNYIWRRRHCLACEAVFTTIERPELATAMTVEQRPGGELQPFSRDRLFMSIYTSCSHRPNAIEDATAITQTVIDKTLSAGASGVIPKDRIIILTHHVLRHFDRAAATHYKAHHPAPSR